jgi:hypothetical protein
VTTIFAITDTVPYLTMKNVDFLEAALRDFWRLDAQILDGVQLSVSLLLVKAYMNSIISNLNLRGQLSGNRTIPSIETLIGRVSIFIYFPRCFGSNLRFGQNGENIRLSSDQCPHVLVTVDRTGLG